MRISYRIVATIALALSLMHAPTLHGQTVSPCRPLDDGGQATLNWVRTTVTSSDSGAIVSRNTLGIPKVAASKVSYVTDTNLCQKAVNAHSAAAGVSAAGRSVCLVKVGRIHVIKDPTVFMGEWWYSMTADSEFKILTKFTG